MADEQKDAATSAKDLVGMDSQIPDDIEIINWDAALAQCSGDKGFLHEMLGMLLPESSSNMEKLRECIPRGSMLEVKYAAHAIKGVATDLMCHRVRVASLYLETAGQAGARFKEGGDDWKTVKDEMEVGLEVLTQELARFEDMLKQTQPVGSEPT